jgi:hypothetical protein
MDGRGRGKPGALAVQRSAAVLPDDHCGGIDRLLDMVGSSIGKMKQPILVRRCPELIMHCKEQACAFLDL